jgi:hypothetical protein
MQAFAAAATTTALRSRARCEGKRNGGRCEQRGRNLHRVFLFTWDAAIVAGTVGLQ